METLVKQVKELLQGLIKEKRLYADVNGEYLEIENVRIYTRSKGNVILPQAFILETKD